MSHTLNALFIRSDMLSTLTDSVASRELLFWESCESCSQSFQLGEHLTSWTLHGLIHSYVQWLQKSGTVIFQLLRHWNETLQCHLKSASIHLQTVSEWMVGRWSSTRQGGSSDQANLIWFMLQPAPRGLAKVHVFIPYCDLCPTCDAGSLSLAGQANVGETLNFEYFL